jgi:uncharacterized protein YjiS (DUF1127 family)
VPVFDAINADLTTFTQLAAKCCQAWEDRRANRREYLRIANELSMYTDRELGELGFGRADIHAIAAGTYRR